MFKKSKFHLLNCAMCAATRTAIPVCLTKAVRRNLFMLQRQDVLFLRSKVLNLSRTTSVQRLSARSQRKAALQKTLICELKAKLPRKRFVQKCKLKDSSFKGQLFYPQRRPNNPARNSRRDGTTSSISQTTAVRK